MRWSLQQDIAPKRKRVVVNSSIPDRDAHVCVCEDISSLISPRSVMVGTEKIPRYADLDTIEFVLDSIL